MTLFKADAEHLIITPEFPQGIVPGMTPKGEVVAEPTLTLDEQKQIGKILNQLGVLPGADVYLAGASQVHEPHVTHLSRELASKAIFPPTDGK